MPEGKPAHVRCVQLSPENRCRLFGLPERPKVCEGFAATLENCGETDEQAFQLLTQLELITRPSH
jgi:Fe-S-cluster containining protein